jgi:hypothetical protein
VFTSAAELRLREAERGARSRAVTTISRRSMRERARAGRRAPRPERQVADARPIEYAVARADATAAAMPNDRGQGTTGTAAPSGKPPATACIRRERGRPPSPAAYHRAAVETASTNAPSGDELEPPREADRARTGQVRRRR